jgi:tRNA (guanine-N7-)-methyltransferase
MPIRLEDPFQDPTTHLRPEVNPFLGRMREAVEAGTLPLLYGPALRPWTGQWRQWFADRDQPCKQLIAEIGCHKGDVLRRMATAHPETGFIGVDITFKRVVLTAEKAARDQLPNLLSILANARALDQLFGEGELDGLIVFFPDPWTRKKRQQKKRLLDRTFMERVCRCLKPGGFLWVKTDHEPYFQQICAAAEELPLQASAAASIWPDEDYTSRFEQFFQDSQQSTFAAIWHKTKALTIDSDSQLTRAKSLEGLGNFT